MCDTIRQTRCQVCLTSSMIAEMNIRHSLNASAASGASYGCLYIQQNNICQTCTQSDIEPSDSQTER